MPVYRLIRQKTGVFLAGEGLSEQGYVRWLAKLVRMDEAPISIYGIGLNGSDPLDLVEAALAKYDALQRQGRRYKFRGLLLDSDLCGKSPNRDTRALWPAAGSEDTE